MQRFLGITGSCWAFAAALAAGAAANTAMEDLPGDASALLQVAPSQQPVSTNESTIPSCGWMKPVDFIVKNFKAKGKGLPINSKGDLKVYGCSNQAFPPSSTKEGSGVVMFLHGAGGGAGSYANIDIHLPDDWNVIFLNTPRSSNSWLEKYQEDSFDHHWVNPEVEDAMSYLTSILHEVATAYGGYHKVWMAGFSQGAVLSSAVALKGTRMLLGGAFIVAGYPPRPLSADDEGGAKDMPSSWSAHDKAQKAKTKIYFYTGEYDTVLPHNWSFCRYSKIMDKYGISEKNSRLWIVNKECHFGPDEDERCGCKCEAAVSPNGKEFEALWTTIKGKPDSVKGVTPQSRKAAKKLC